MHFQKDFASEVINLSLLLEILLPTSVLLRRGCRWPHERDSILVGTLYLNSDMDILGIAHLTIGNR